MAALSSDCKIKDLFNSVIHYATQVLDAERGALFLIDEETGEMYSQVAKGKLKNNIVSLFCLDKVFHDWNFIIALV